MGSAMGGGGFSASPGTCQPMQESGGWGARGIPALQTHTPQDWKK